MIRTDRDKSREELLAEVEALRSRVAALEAGGRADIVPAAIARSSVAAARSAEERFTRCLDNLLNCFGIFTAVRDAGGAVVDFRIDYLNKAACANNRLTLDQQIGRNLCDVLPGHRRSGLFELYKRVVDTGEGLELSDFRYEDGYAGERVSRVFQIRAFRLDDGFAATWRDVTDHESDARYRAMVDALPVPAWVSRPDGRVRHFNPKWVEATGLPPEPDGTSWIEAYHPDDRAPLMALRSAAIGRGEAYVVEVRFRHVASDGYRLHRAHVAPVRGNDGQVLAWIGTAVDIEDLRQAEDAVRASDSRMRLALDAGRMGAWEWDFATDKVEWSAGHYTLFGYGPGDGTVPYSMFADRVHPDDLATVQAEVRAAIESRREYNSQFRVVRPDGTTKWIAGRGRAVYDDAGKPLRMYGVITDISREKAVEEALRDSEFRHRALFEALPQICWVNRPDGSVEYFNRRWTDYTGLPPRPEGTSWVLSFHPDDRERLRAVRTDGIARGVEYEVEARLRRTDGAYRWHTCRVSPVRDAGGAVFAWLGTAADIDDLRQAEAAARGGEERFRLIADTIPQVVWTARADGVPDYFNARTARYTGRPTEVLCGEGWVEVIHPDDRERVLAGWERSVATGADYDIEFRLRRADGAWRWHVTRAQPVRDAAGGAVRWFGTCTDVHAQRDAETTARESGERLAAALTAARTGTFRWDIRTNGLEWDENLDRLFGLPPGQTVRSLDAFVERVHPDDRAGVIDRCRRCAGDGTDFEMDFRVVWPDGSVHWLYDQGKTIRGGDGRPAYMTGACVDITVRKLQEQALEANQATLAIAEQTAGMGWFEWDIVGGAIWWSPGLEAIYGVPPGGAPRTREAWMAMIHPDDAVRVDALAAESLATGTYAADQRIVRPDGQVRWVLARARVLKDDTGRPVRMVGVATDITDRKAAEEQLAAANREVERASRAKDEFLAALSHELRTPLSPILMTTQAMELDPGLSPEMRADLATIRRSVELEARLIDDLLDLTRIARGKLHLHPELIDLHEVIRHAVRTCCDDTVGEKRLTVGTDLAAHEHLIWGDEARVAQILWNLVRNAIKFTPPGGAITVRTAVTRPGVIAVIVTDTGVGIAPDVLPHVFTAFEQGGADVTRRFGGLGLGLAICRALSEMHGATIRASSAGKGKGATFTVEFPLAVDTAPAGPPRLPISAPAATTAAPVSPGPAPAPVTVPAPTAAEAARPTPSTRLLLVEDHEQTGKILSRLLANLGYDVTWRASVAAAHSAAAGGTFDLVVSDLGLPDGSGLDLMDQLRRSYGLRGIALTGFGMEQDLQRSAESGFVAHLVKPVTVQKLDEVIRKHL